MASLGHSERSVVLGRTLNTHTLMKTDEQKKVLSKFMILCWAAFLAILVHWLKEHSFDDNLNLARESNVRLLTSQTAR